MTRARIFRSGFTLIELLVVISVIGMLASIVLVSLQSTRAKAKIASAVVFQTNLYHALGSNAVLQLNFEEGNGTSAADKSLMGNSNNGTLTAGTSWSTTDTYDLSVSKSAVSITGTGKISFTRGLGLSNSNFTVSQWVKTTNGNMGAYTFGNSTFGAGYGFGLSIGQVAFTIGPLFGVQTGRCPNAVANDGQWHHIAGVFDRSGGVWTGYLDGKQMCQVSILPHAGLTDSAPLIPCVGLASFDGLIDDTYVFAQNLSGVSILELYESQKGNYLALK